MDATKIPIAQHLHAKVEALIGVEEEEVLMDLLGEDGWDAWQQLGDILNPTEASGDVAEEFWNNN